MLFLSGIQISKTQKPLTPWINECWWRTGPILSGLCLALEELLHVLLEPDHKFIRQSHAWFFCSFNGMLKKDAWLVLWQQQGWPTCKLGHPLFFPPESIALCSVSDQVVKKKKRSKKKGYGYVSISKLFEENFVIIIYTLFVFGNTCNMEIMIWIWL